MAHFLKGNFKSFSKAGESACVKDVFRFRQTENNKLYYELTRRDMESKLGRFWRYESATINLIPVDAENPRLGGKVSATQLVFDVRTMTPSRKTYFGVYGEDFLTFGEYKKDAKYPIDDEETLLKIFEE